LFGAKIGDGVMVRPTAKITYPWKLSIGDYAWVGDDVVLYTLDQITIGANAVVSQKSYICTGTHDLGSIAFDIFGKPIVIGPEAWIATDVFVAPGVSIGRGVIVGARSAVFKDIPEGMIAKGSPARIIRPRTKNPAEF
jgi:putative colanic acid biosynthesis acetyltransferase WcaF